MYVNKSAHKSIYKEMAGMIKIIIEVHHHGKKPETYEEYKNATIAQARIFNDGTGTKGKGNYHYCLDLKRKGAWRTGEIKGFARKSKNVWFLLKEILKQI